MRYKNGIIVLFFLFLVEISVAADPYNYAERWRSWNIVAREAYISGLVDGIAEAYHVTLTTIAPDKSWKSPEPVEVKKVREKLFVRYTKEQIGDIITDLYKDPANVFISTLDMFFLARDKIEGKDIAKDIMDSRKKAMDTHGAIEEMKKR